MPYKDLEKRRECKRQWEKRNRHSVYLKTKRLREANPERHKLNAHRSQLKRRGLSIPQFDEMLLNQGGGCAICTKTQYTNSSRRLSVDHCHETGKVRELLCNRCNTFLGYIEKNPGLLVKAITYLEKHG